MTRAGCRRESNVQQRGVRQMQERRPVMLVILDGWGWRENPTDKGSVEDTREKHSQAR